MSLLLLLRVVLHNISACVSIQNIYEMEKSWVPIGYTNKQGEHLCFV